MTSEIDSNRYQKGLDLAEDGRHEEALECIHDYLRTSPENSEALNDAGAILHCLGRSEEAIEHFLKARRCGDSSEILWNLAEAYLGAGQAKEAMKLFSQMSEKDILNVDVVTRTATSLLNQDDKANAIEVLLHSFNLWPVQRVLKPMIEIIRSQRPKIAFFCGGDGRTFLNEIIDFTERRFEIRIFEGQTEDELYELMKWSDISWFEWCTNLAVSATNRDKVCKMIIRLHRYEAYSKWPPLVNWSNVDVLVTLGNSITRRTLLERVSNLEELTDVITVPNGINLDKFQLNERRRGKNIAFLANLRMVKNPAFILQCIQKLHYIDSEYRLFFAGAFQDLVVEQYLRHMVESLELGDVVFFDGWQEDVNSWLKDKDYIVSTSICEGHPVGLLEGMACGLKPVVHNFLGADEVFPSEFIFNISEEFCEQIFSEQYEPERYRKFVEDNYSLKEQLGKINDIFTRFEIQQDLHPVSSRIEINSLAQLSSPKFEKSTVF